MSLDNEQNIRQIALNTAQSMGTSYSIDELLANAHKIEAYLMLGLKRSEDLKKK
jgi:hypothetical protein